MSDPSRFGVLSYVRTGEAVDSMAYFRLGLNRFRIGLHTTSNADNLLRYLDEIVKTQAVPDDELATLARETQDAFIRANRDGVLSDQYYRKAMDICATAWKKANPIKTTSIAMAFAAAERDYRDPLSSALTKRKASEELGVLNGYWQVFALNGEDLLTGKLPLHDLGRGYRNARDSNGQLLAFESGSSYNVNLLLTRQLDGQSLVFVVEAKGGTSQFTSVKGSTDFRKDYRVAPGATISQTSPLYALSRAYYMKNNSSTHAGFVARREAGDMILVAERRAELVYIGSRAALDQSGNMVTSRPF